MRVLFTCVPYTGHFHPLVPFAQSMVEAGHSVAFASGLQLQPLVEASGFQFFPAGVNAEQHQAVNQLISNLLAAQDLAPLAARDFFAEHKFIEQLPLVMLPDLNTLCAAWSPDLIISESSEFAGCVAAEQFGIAYATLKIVNIFNYNNRYSFLPYLDYLRASVGLPPDPEVNMIFDRLYLVAEPPALIPARVSLPASAFHLRRYIFDQSGEEALPTWLADLTSGWPVVFATLGTLFNRVPGQFENILAALKDEPLELIVALGRDRDPADFGEQPSNVHLERYIPQSLLFAYCDLIVSHAGSGTILAALEYGLPLVNLPIFADQPENAALCAELGVGLTVPLEERTPELIRAAVQKVLADPSYRNKARQIQAEMRALPGMEEVISLFERLVAEKQPLN